MYSQSGGAQYCRGTTQDDDLLAVYAEAFERDKNPEDYSLDAILAHERGHQILAWHPRIAKLVAGMSLKSEEILASIIGAILCHSDTDRENLIAKVAVELAMVGHPSDTVNPQVQKLRRELEAML